MLATHQDAEQRYSKLRLAALNIAQETLAADNIRDIRLSEITAEALLQTKMWERSPLRSKKEVDWSWFDDYNHFKFRYPKRFEMAIWQASKLIGMSIGRRTYNGTAMRLDVVEASPPDLGERPAIFETVLLGYEIYAKLVNAKQIRIMNPVNDKIRAYYEQFGYQYSQESNYLYTEVL